MQGSHPTTWLARAPLLLAVGFLALFALVPLLWLAVQTILGPDGVTLVAWQELFRDEQDLARLWASIQLGLSATALALLLGAGHALVCFRTDLPLARFLLPLGIAPLVAPPIFVAMAFADALPVAGFWPCAVLLGIAGAPFCAVLAGRGLRSVDGRAYEAALLLRGPTRANVLLVRSIAPELGAGALLAFLMTVADHGVPEFLTVKGKTWHTYAEGIFSRWNRRGTGTSFADLQSPIVAAIPFVLLLGLLLWLALRMRALGDRRASGQLLPVRRLGRWRWPLLLVPTIYLGCGLLAPIVCFVRWAMGSAQKREPMSLEFARQSFHKAMDQGLTDFGNSVLLASLAALLCVLLALPLARASARRVPWLQACCALPAAAPAILLGIGMVRAYHDATPLRLFGRDFYDGFGFAVCGYAARLLPFTAVLLTAQVQRIPLNRDEAALLCARSPLARAVRIHLPPLLPAAWTAAILAFVLGLRELDLAVILPAANATAVRRLANAVHFQHEDWSGVIALMLLFTAVLLPLIPTVLAGKRLAHLS